MEIAEELADFFNRISVEINPLEPHQISITTQRVLPLLHPAEVSKRIKQFRKPKSMVLGDVFPDVLTKYADFFAIPLTDIFNEISRTFK